MNRSVLVVLVVAMTGCASVRVGPPERITVGESTVTMAGLEGFNAFEVRRPDPHNPNVFITERATIVVDQEPVRPTLVTARKVFIAWALDAAADNPYTFPDDSAIAFAAGPGNPLPSNFACKARLPRKKVIVCSYDKPDRPAQWKYMIRVVDGAGRELTKLDPWVHQD